MSKEEGLSFIDSTGDDSFSLSNIKKGNESIEDLAALFLLKIQEKAKDKLIIDTGEMISGDNFKQTISTTPDTTELEMFMVYYADFVNKGVKGFIDDSNAPNSPYSYKRIGIAKEGREKILKRVESGKMKISDTSKTKYGLEKLENKALKTPNQSEINKREAERIAYLISAYGIKTTNFIDEAWKEWKKELPKNLSKVARIILIESLKKINKVG